MPSSSFMRSSSAGGHAGGVEVLAGDDRRLLDEAVLHRAAQGVVLDDVAEWRGLLAAGDIGGGGELQAEDGVQLVDGADARRGAVAMRLVHEEDEVRQLREPVEVALADVLGEALDAGSVAAAHLGVDLGDVEDIDAALDERVEEAPGIGFPRIAGDDIRRVGGEGADAPEDVLRGAGGEVADELVVDRQVRGEDEEVVDAVGGVEVANERAHEAGFADAGGEGEAERGEVALEILYLRVLAADDFEADRRRHRLLVPAGRSRMTRSRISRPSRWGLRKLRRPAMALTSGLMTVPPVRTPAGLRPVARPATPRWRGCSRHVPTPPCRARRLGSS